MLIDRLSKTSIPYILLDILLSSKTSIPNGLLDMIESDELKLSTRKLPFCFGEE